METNKIFDKLEEMYKKDEKSKNFVLHLVRAYMPIDKITKVLEKPADLSKFKCALTSVKLISADEIFQGINTDEFKANFINDLKIVLDESGQQVKKDPAILKVTNGKLLGFTGKDTNTYMCNEACEQLLNWVSTKILQGDSKINWTVRSMQGKNQPKKKNTQRPQSSQTSQMVHKPATSSLGDFSVLQSLKDKLEKQENK